MRKTAIIAYSSAIFFCLGLIGLSNHQTIKNAPKQKENNPQQKMASRTLNVPKLDIYLVNPTDGSTNSKNLCAKTPAEHYHFSRLSGCWINNGSNYNDADEPRNDTKCLDWNPH